MNNKEKLYLVKLAFAGGRGDLKSPISGKAILALLSGGLGGGLGALIGSGNNNNPKNMAIGGIAGAALGGLTGYGVGALDEHIQKKQKEWLAEDELRREKRQMEEQTFDTKEEAFEYMKKTDPEMYKRFADANFKYDENIRGF
jgi:hypothetical protein